MNVLDEIMQNKAKEVQENISLYPVKLLEKSIHFNSPCVSLKNYLKRNDLNGIIAEFKRKSPSKGVINNNADVEQCTLGYMQAGASALSVLTDNKYFGGKNEDLRRARKVNFCPILRKDFILDEYQIIEAKSIGADAILLIAAALEKSKIKNLGEFALSLGLEVLLEIHEESEIDKISNSNFIIGFNSRNLKTMVVNTNEAFNIYKKLPAESIKVAESGLSNPEIVVELKNLGYQGFLIGENFMKQGNPSLACKNFIQEVKSKLSIYAD